MAFPPANLTPPSLQTWQFQTGGVTLGADTPYPVKAINGLDLAPIRSGDQARPRDQGELAGLDLYAGRDITFDMWVTPDTTSLQSALLTLAAATEVAGSVEQPLWLQLPNLPLLAVMGRTRKRVIPIDANYGAANIVTGASFLFHSTDPRLYGATQQTSVPLPTPSGGMSFPAGFPLTFGATGSSGGVSITNAGNSETRPQLTINGPCTNPSIENASITGAPALTVSNPAQTGYTVAAGDQLVIDLDLRSVLYYTGGVGSGTAGASRQNWVVPGSVWWTLQPGANQIHFLSGDTSQTGATVTVAYAPAYQL